MRSINNGNIRGTNETLRLRSRLYNINELKKYLFYLNLIY